MKGACPKCGWTTRELDEEECNMVREGRYRCSGACMGGDVRDVNLGKPPILKLVETEAEKDDGNN